MMTDWNIPELKGWAVHQGDGPPEESAAVSLGVEELVVVYKMLSDETRFRILLYLWKGDELNVTEMCARLRQSQPAVSHHLALMREAGLVSVREEGKCNYYSIRRDARKKLALAFAFPSKVTGGSADIEERVPGGSETLAVASETVEAILQSVYSSLEDGDPVKEHWDQCAGDCRAVIERAMADGTPYAHRLVTKLRILRLRMQG